MNQFLISYNLIILLRIIISLPFCVIFIDHKTKYLLHSYVIQFSNKNKNKRSAVPLIVQRGKKLLQ